MSITSSHSVSPRKGIGHVSSPQLFYKNTEEASGVRSRLTPDNVTFVRYTALFRKFTDIGSAMKKLKKKRKIKPATPNFHFS